MKEPTQRQWEVLSFIARFIETNRFPPTIREIGGHFAISVKGAYDHVAALRRKGYLTAKEGHSRTLELVTNAGKREPEAFLKVPFLGTVPAGLPSTPAEYEEGCLTLHRSFLKKSAVYFALTVRGDSMEGAGILDGDTAVVEQCSDARNGDIAVIETDDKVTLKRFFREKTSGKGKKEKETGENREKENADRIRLQPENPEYQPRYYTRDVRVLGRLAAVIRRYRLG